MVGINHIIILHKKVLEKYIYMLIRRLYIYLYVNDRINISMYMFYNSSHSRSASLFYVTIVPNISGKSVGAYGRKRRPFVAVQWPSLIGDGK